MTVEVKFLVGIWSCLLYKDFFVTPKVRQVLQESNDNVHINEHLYASEPKI